MTHRLAFLSIALAVAAGARGAEPAAEARGLPFVYSKWKHLTTADGLPNDHIFAVRADGPRVWIGTEDGLALFDKRTGKVRSWRHRDENKDGRDDAGGLPWKVVTAIDVDPKTGDVWLGLFGGGLARFSGGRFDHYNQLNSGLVSDVVYGIALENDSVWAATTAGASRFNVKTGQWTIFTEKNAPMEEIWNYGVTYAPPRNRPGGSAASAGAPQDQGKVYLAVWGSGCLEYDVATGRWKEYLDPDGEMEIDLHRDDGIIHVITTGASFADDALWVSTYFGTCRYDGRRWRGFYAHETGLPSDFTNNVKARSGTECYFATDKGLGAIADFASETAAAYTHDPKTGRGAAKVYRAGKLVEEVALEKGMPHNYAIALDVDGADLWVGTSKGLGWAIGEGYYPGLKERPAAKP